MSSSIILISIKTVSGHFTYYFKNTGISNCMNGVLYELFARAVPEYMRSPSVNMAAMCLEIVAGLRTKLLRDMTSNQYNSMKNDMTSSVSDINICIILFLYFGVPGITLSDILINDNAHHDAFVPIFLIKLKNYNL